MINKANEYNQMSGGNWNADVMKAESFLDITKNGLQRQFKEAIMDPYEDMLDALKSTPAPVAPAPVAPAPAPKVECPGTMLYPFLYLLTDSDPPDFHLIVRYCTLCVIQR